MLRLSIEQQVELPPLSLHLEDLRPSGLRRGGLYGKGLRRKILLLGGQPQRGMRGLNLHRGDLRR
jgi:hypothetical protein